MKSTKLIATISSIALASSLVGCSSSSRPDEPTDKSCKDWDWDASEGVYECDDSSSRHYGSYFYGGTYYSNKSNLKSNSSYKSYKSSSSFKGSSGSSSSSSGFGKGSTSSGG